MLTIARAVENRSGFDLEFRSVRGDGSVGWMSGKGRAFTDESEHVALLLASHAAVAYVGARTRRQMAEALATRELVGQATGILMERHRLSADAAFARAVEVVRGKIEA